MVFMGDVIYCLKDTKWSRMLSGILSEAASTSCLGQLVTAARFPFLGVGFCRFLPLPQAPEILSKDGLLNGPAVLIWFVDVGWIV